MKLITKKHLPRRSFLRSAGVAVGLPLLDAMIPAGTALAQTAALLSFESMGQEPDADTVVYFVGIDGARFKRVVEPGDQLILEATIDRARAGIYKYKVRASVGGETAVEAELMCTMRKVA